MTPLEQAYRNTRYLVFNTAIEIKIEQYSPQLDILLDKHNANEWAFITSENPFSKQLAAEENVTRHQQLLEKVKEYHHFEGEGIGEDPNHKPEKSLLIIGISAADAISLGKHFEQNAIVLGKKNEPAQLQMLVAIESPMQKDQKKLSGFMKQLNSGKSFDELDKETQSWWMNRY
jgi:hypothetical protein